MGGGERERKRERLTDCLNFISKREIEAERDGGRERDN